MRARNPTPPPIDAESAGIAIDRFGTSSSLTPRGNERTLKVEVRGRAWARSLGVEGQRPVEDIDVLVLGEPDRNELYRRVDGSSARLGRPVQVTIRDAGWLATGDGSFHDTITNRPMVPIPLEAGSSTG